MTEKRRCSFCGASCWPICYIANKLACLVCFEQLALTPAVTRRDGTTS